MLRDHPFPFTIRAYLRNFDHISSKLSYVIIYVVIRRGRAAYNNKQVVRIAWTEILSTILKAETILLILGNGTLRAQMRYMWKHSI